MRAVASRGRSEPLRLPVLVRCGWYYNEEVKKYLFFVPILLGVATIIVTSGTAHAYSVQGNAPAGGGSSLDFNGLLSPLQNFIESIRSINANSIPQLGPTSFSPSLNPTNSFITTNAQGAIQQFDTWFYGVAGFHIIGLLTAILGIFSWLLGLVKNVVDWLLGLIHQ